MANLHGVVPTKDHIPPEDLHSVLEVPGGKQDISSDQLVLGFVNMLLQILLPGKSDNFLTHFHFHCDLLLTNFVHFVMYFAA